MTLLARFSAGALGLALVLAVSPAQAAPKAAPKPAPQQTSRPSTWTAAWASSQMIPDSNNALSNDDLYDLSLRQIVRITTGGTRIRLRLSNAFGTAPLRFDAVSIAQSADNATSRIVPLSSHPVTFAGQPSVIIPAGAEYLSDAIDMPVTALEDLAITTWQPGGANQQTSHPGSRATSYVLHGIHTSDSEFTAPKTVDHWFQLAGIEVEAPNAAAIAIIGDSITDGRGSTTNSNNRWPDVLMPRLQRLKRPLAVLNQGIGGNRLLLDGLGPNALARLDRDVLAQAGVRYLIVFEGVNDIGTATRDAAITPEAHTALVSRMILAYQQMIERAHAHGIKVIGATITPMMGMDYYHPDASNEADRQAVNAWIRAPGHFDGVIDFDAVVRDPTAPDHLKAEYDSGDHLHPSVAGYKAMGESVDLKLFDR